MPIGCIEYTSALIAPVKTVHASLRFQMDWTRRRDSPRKDSGDAQATPVLGGCGVPPIQERSLSPPVIREQADYWANAAVLISSAQVLCEPGPENGHHNLILGDPSSLLGAKLCPLLSLEIQPSIQVTSLKKPEPTDREAIRKFPAKFPSEGNLGSDRFARTKHTARVFFLMRTR